MKLIFAVGESNNDSFCWSVVGVSVLTLLWLLLDIRTTSKSLDGILKVKEFYLLLIIQSFLSVIAYFALEVSSGAKFVAFVGNTTVAHWSQALFAVVGSATVLQSFNLKLGGNKLLDVGSFIDRYRKDVLSEVGSVSLDTKTNRKLKLVSLLAEKYKDHGNDLRDELSSVLFSSTGDRNAVATALKEIETGCNQCGMNVVRGYAESLVAANVTRASDLVK